MSRMPSPSPSPLRNLRNTGPTSGAPVSLSPRCGRHSLPGLQLRLSASPSTPGRCCGQGSAALTLREPADRAIVHRQNVARDGTSRVRVCSIIRVDPSFDAIPALRARVAVRDTFVIGAPK
eukprot:2288567-Rhodomonas_salina.1